VRVVVSALCRLVLYAKREIVLENDTCTGIGAQTRYEIREEILDSEIMFMRYARDVALLQQKNERHVPIMNRCITML